MPTLVVGGDPPWLLVQCLSGLELFRLVIVAVDLLVLAGDGWRQRFPEWIPCGTRRELQ